MMKMAVVFPGQGSQYVGMGKQLLSSFPEASLLFEEANDTLGYNLKELCLEGNLQELARTMNSQPAILTTSVIAYHYFVKEFGIIPSFAAGHSLGEYAALIATGALRFQEGLSIVRQRGLFMEEAVSADLGKMIAVKGAAHEWIEQVCMKLSSEHAPIFVACYNTPGQTVVSIHRTAISKFTEVLERNRVLFTLLNVSGPFHSPLMQSAADKLALVLNQYSFNEFRFPVISNVTALPYPSKGNIVDGLLLQMIHPVKWEASVRYMVQRGVKLFVELGPNAVLSRMAKEIEARLEAFSLDQQPDIIKLKKFVSDRYAAPLSYFIQCLNIAISTPNHSRDERKYEEGVLLPVRKLKELLQEQEQTRVIPSTEKKREGYELLRLVLQTKELPFEEQEALLSEIIAS